MVDNDNRARELSEDIEKLFRKAGLTETDVTEAIATIRNARPLTTVNLSKN
jgi:hypothetical protein